MNEFTQLGAHLQKEIVDSDNLDLILGDDAIKGIAVMLREGRNKENVRHIARAIAKTGGLDDAMKIDMINRYFKLVGDLDVHHSSAEIGRQLYGDMGKLLYNSTTNSYNTGFIKGLFHQLEFLEHLRTAEKTVESIENGITVDKVQRRIDVIADGGRHFELKNFTNYGPDQIKDVVKGLRKDLAIAMKDATDEILLDNLSKLHFVFRGHPSSAGLMIEAMEKAGLKMLKKGKFKKSRELFEKQIASARNAVNQGGIKNIPALEDLVVFQGKSVPY